MRFKWPKSLKSLKKITRLNFQNLMFLFATHGCYIITFKMLKLELKFEHIRLAKKV